MRTFLIWGSLLVWLLGFSGMVYLSIYPVNTEWLIYGHFIQLTSKMFESVTVAWILLCLVLNFFYTQETRVKFRLVGAYMLLQVFTLLAGIIVT